jgi:hypothetical protein
MVTATERPHVLRVAFFEFDTDKQKTEIVCLVKATDHGAMEIIYHSHTNQSRPNGKGTWEPKTSIRYHILSPAIEAAVRAHVMYELFSTFATAPKLSMEESK